MSNTEKSYHHGELKIAILNQATEMIRESGVHGFSMRQLAQKLGVSRTAAYHHFKDRQEILEALAFEGFSRHKAWLDELKESSDSFENYYREYVKRYVAFADESPEIYELMFGADIWRRQTPSAELEAFAKNVFVEFIDWVRLAQDRGQVNRNYTPLVAGQLAWATIHGICRLLIDGVYTDAKSLSVVVDAALEQIMAGVFSR